ncbi:Fur family transcriptional regulator [Pseudodesulfovibrio alkaliphilus]|nr:Fur family transcriptional regulator [Pseudodesulfovibrio alkaliphilus]
MKKDYCVDCQGVAASSLPVARLNENIRSRSGRPRFKSASREVDDGIDQFKEYLESNNLKLTPQRRRILMAFLAMREPFSAEELLAASGGVESGISLSTLYRALSHLQGAGLARRVGQAGVSCLYEVVSGHSCQLVCENCGRRVSVSNPFLESMREVAALQEGFVLRHCTARYYGLCPDCGTRHGIKSGLD